MARMVGATKIDLLLFLGAAVQHVGPRAERIPGLFPSRPRESTARIAPALRRALAWAQRRSAAPPPGVARATAILALQVRPRRVLVRGSLARAHDVLGRR